MTRKQILVVSGFLLIGATVFLLPREGYRKKESESKNQVDDAELQFQTQLGAVKKSTEAKALVKISFFEDRLKKANGTEKFVWFDSLSSVWDRQMRPGIAAEYVYQKAELSNNMLDWLAAGKRYLGLARFFEGDDKSAFSQRAIDCLVKANALNPKNNEIKTQLGIAYVSGSQEPMKGIMLLREAVSADSTNLEAQLNLGFFSMQSGQYDKAVSRFEKVLAMQPDLNEVLIYLSDALEAQGDKKNALKALNQLKKNSTDTVLLKEAETRIQRIQ